MEIRARADPLSVALMDIGLDSFRPLQREAITSLLNKQDCVVVVATGERSAGHAESCQADTERASRAMRPAIMTETKLRNFLHSLASFCRGRQVLVLSVAMFDITGHLRRCDTPHIVSERSGGYSQRSLTNSQVKRFVHVESTAACMRSINTGLGLHFS